MFENEIEFENHVRSLITAHIASKYQDLVLLQNKDVVDIILCKNSETPSIFFLEAKYYTARKNRMGFGDAKGNGFQTEILSRRPAFFDANMRWVFGTEENDQYYILTNDQASEFICGGIIGEKQNNFQLRLFSDFVASSENELIQYLKDWLELK